jgi:GNAT superfamily N-acetyltransferase
VRRAGTGDIDTIADVFVASFRSLEFVPLIHTDDDIRRWIREEMVPGHEVWVAEDERDGVVGLAALKDDLLGHLYVRPDAQGRGAGSALFERVQAERPAGFRFWVFQQNERARRFYERRGCRVVELGDGSGNMEKLPDALYEWVPTSAEPAPRGAAARESSAR